MRAWGFAALLIFCNPTFAGECRVHSSTIRLESGFTVIPFAVPVAVPVATIQNPTVLYGYTSMPNESKESSAAAMRPTESSVSHTILTKHCHECHTAAAAQGGFTLFDGQGRLLNPLPRQAILEMVSPNAENVQQMPPGKRLKLTPNELQAIRDWAKPPKDLKY